MVRATVRLIAASALVSLALGCGGGGSSPTSPSATPPSPVTVSALAVTGCAASDGFQCRANATYSNQTTQDVTSQTQWSTSDNAVATISSAGVVRHVGPGTFQVRATFQTVSASRDQTSSVEPPRFYAIEGVVRDSSGRPIQNASVVATDSAGTRQSRTTDGGGYFHVAPLRAGTVTISISAIGFDAATRTVTLTADVRISDVTLPTTAPAPSNACTGVPSSASCGKPTAGCSDGTWSCSQNRSGTCSSHGGVKCWVCPGPLC